MKTAKNSYFAFWLSIGVFGIAFIGFFLAVAACARLATDDFCALTLAQHVGVIGSVVEWWHSWTGRWMAQGIVAFVAPLVAHDAVVTLYVWALMLGFFLSLSFFLRQAARRFKFELTWWQELLLGLTFTALFLFASVERAEAWFWLAGSAVHAVPILPFLVLLGCVIKKNPSRLDSAVACVCAALTTGASEGVAVATFVVLVILLVKSPVVHRKRLLWPLLFFCVSAIPVLAAPGNWHRLNLENKEQHFSFLLVVRSVAHLFKAQILMRGGWFLALISFGGATGFVVETKHFKNGNRQPAKACLFIGLSSLVCAVMSALPPIISFSGNAPTRSWTITTLILCLGIFAISVLAAAAFKLRFPRVGPRICYGVGILSWMGCALALTGYFRVDLPRTRSAVALFDNQYAFLRSKSSSCQGTLTVALLPQTQWPVPQWVVWGQPMPQSDHWISTCMRDALGLPCDLRRDR
ncbi:hypothetical protein B1R32_102260 [Abditibacterium utsteinense]|uniref:Uncharacterized protein n=1 Tax=Abditibacterium utsteinense TaxID=1960156 RepID=A0A2S8SWT0_9BACT|nr:DUF6056 family protein [Abditibacterium utsteinense]PQV65251.1 hypothetical protein B1R32_102260 [Abditibacterium utsteinense]